MYLYLKDILAGLSFLIFALIFYSQTSDLSGISLLFPQSLIIFLILGSLYLIVKGLIRRKHMEMSNDDPVKVPRVVLISIMSIAYVIIIPMLGFFVASAIFLFLAALAFREKEKTLIQSTVISLIFTAVFCFFVWLCFVTLLSVPTPDGMFF